MSQIIPYINFADRGQEAVEFYKSVFQTGDQEEHIEIQHVKDTPMAANMPAEWGDRIMHLAFQVGDIKFFGSDIISDQAGKVPGNQMNLTIVCDSAEQLNDYYAKLSAGGKSVFEPSDSEWGSVFAQCVDKFDVTWMLNYGNPVST